MAQFRKKPVVVEAMRLPTENHLLIAFHHWCDVVGFRNWASGGDGTIEIETLEGTMTAAGGDYIIKGVKGEFYPCKPDIFALTYEAVE